MDEIRFLRREDMRQNLELISFAFQFKMSDEDVEESHRMDRPKEFLGYFVDGNLAAGLRIRPLHMFVDGQSYAMGGIASVCSWPEHRRKGMVAQLLQRSLEVMRDKGQSVSMLAPFSFPFYRRYGWEHCIDRKHYRINANQLPHFEEIPGSLARTSDWREVQPLYNEYALQFSGTLDRSDEWWEHSVVKNKNGIFMIYRDQRGAAAGYIFYRVWERELRVYEMVPLTENARKALWNVMKNHDSMIERVSIHAPVTDTLPFLLPDPRIQQEISAYFMARIVDVRQFIEQFVFVPSGTTEYLAISVTDPHAAWNNQRFDIHVDPTGRAVVNEGSHGSIDAMECDIQTLTVMLLGSQRPLALHRIGRLKGSERSALQWEKLLPSQVTYLMDSF